MAASRKVSWFQAPAARAGSRSWTALALVLLTAVGVAHCAPAASGAAQEQPAQAPLADSARQTASSRHRDLGALPPAVRMQISAGIGEDDPAYHVLPQPDGYRVETASHAVSAAFTAAGAEFSHGSDRWGVALRGYGYGGALRQAAAARPTASANRVEYRRGGLTEWYVNGPFGLEQGFTFAHAPGDSNGEALTLALGLSGNLTPAVAQGARSLTLSRDGTVGLRYGGLAAWDAAGRELPAWLEIVGDELHVRVDDAGAQFPVSVDPYVQAPKLTTAKPCDPAGVCDDGAAGDQFGYSAGISADASTVVVGVPFKYTNSLIRGALYVFVKPSDYEGGWNSIYPIYYKAKLLASDGATTGAYLGYSVDVSRDGGTIVAGARGFGSATGGAYVFVRPAGGWGAYPTQTQTAKLTAAAGNGVGHGSFGHSIAMSGDGGTIAVGAPETEIASVYRGAAYVFLRPAAGWIDATESQAFAGAQMSLHGWSVALSDDASLLAVGAPNEDPLGGAVNYVGKTYLLARQASPGSPGSYSRVATLAASDGIPRDMFGYAVGASGDGSTVVVGAPVIEDDTVPHPGAAYVFVRPSRGWGAARSAITETAKLTGSDQYENDQLGQSVDISLDGATIIAGAIELPQLPGTNPGPGSAYVFARPAAGWSSATENARLLSAEGLTGDRFGHSTALSGDGHVALVGAPFQTIDASVWQGAVYIFTGSAGVPLASVTPSEVAFAPQSVGTTSSPKTVTLTNVGSGPLHVTGVGTTGPFASTQNCVAASPIAPGASCSEAVVFAPLSTGSQTGFVVFTDDSGGVAGSNQYVRLEGSGKKATRTTGR